jgi:hypothetical protein
MSIKLEVTFGSFEELAEFAARTGVSRPIEKATPKPVAEKNIAVVKQEEIKEDTKAATQEKVEVPANPKFDDVKAAILNLNKIKGKVAAVGVLNKFGAEKVGPQLKEADYGAVIAECNKVLAEA